MKFLIDYPIDHLNILWWWSGFDVELLYIYTVLSQHRTLHVLYCSTCIVLQYTNAVLKLLYREEISSCALVEMSTVLKLKLNMYRKSTAHNLYVHCLVQYTALYTVLFVEIRKGLKLIICMYTV